jgi:phosphoribosylamine-glycine ligase
VCDTRAEAEAALRQIMVERAFGAAGDQVLIETRLDGEEASLLAFCDGTTVVPMLPPRDTSARSMAYAGLNTAGWAATAPRRTSRRRWWTRPPGVLQPVVDGMRRRGTP